jgi:hypothetical protein
LLKDRDHRQFRDQTLDSSHQLGSGFSVGSVGGIVGSFRLSSESTENSM